MEQSKEIKIYGTLVNHTLDPNKSDSSDPLKHHDAIANAKELFDERFHTESRYNNESVVEKYQDRINRRVTGISYSEGNPGETTIEGDLFVTGDTNIGGELKVQNDAYFYDDIHVEGDTHVTNLYVSGETDLTLNDLNDVEVSDVRDRQTIIYDAHTGKWVPGNTDGVKKLNDLEDVNIVNPTNGNILVYEDGAWVVAEDGDGNPINLTQIINRIKKLEGMWKWNNETTKAYLEPATNTDTTKVRAHSFYDTSVS